MTCLFSIGLNAEPFVDVLLAVAFSHRSLRHPSLASLADGSLHNFAWALADFARKYRGYSAHFCRYLAAQISRLDDAAKRQLLLSNLIEESGQYDAAALSTLVSLGLHAEWFVGKPHPELFRRFSRALTNQDEEGGDENLARGMHKSLALGDSFCSWLHQCARMVAS